MAACMNKNEGKPSENRAAFLFRNAAIGFAGLLGVVLLIRLVLVRSYNYDELSHAHMAWLVSVGNVPYRDFAANHFPFLWILMSPLMRVLPESPVALMYLRGLALLLNTVFIGALGTLICLEQSPQQRIWGVACFGLVVFSPLALHFLIEFRPDALANALLFSTLAWLRLRITRGFPTGFVGGFCIGVAVLVNTKYIMLPFILGIVAPIMYARQVRQIWPFALAICLGFSVAILAGVLLLVGIGVSLDDGWRMVVTYNAMAQKAHPFGFGLARKLTQSPVWPAYGLVGLIGCIVLFLRQRRLPELLAVAFGIFLAVNLVTTTKPWKQYVVSWLLLAAYFPARSLPLLITRLRPLAQAAAALCVLIIVVAGLVCAGIVDPNGGGMNRPTQDRTIEWILQHVPPDGFVVSSFYLHPVFRRDTFFKTVVDIAPNVGDGLEQFMPQLAPGPYREHFQRSGYERELEVRPPAVIVVDGAYTFAQSQALNAYRLRHPGTYEQYNIPGTAVIVLQRKTDRTPEEK